jgi:hypothetical protein
MGVLERIRSRIWVPPSLRQKFTCLLCGAEFTESESILYEQHVAKCAAEHHDQIIALQKATRPEGLFKAADSEYFDWIRTHERGY